MDLILTQYFNNKPTFIFRQRQAVRDIEASPSHAQLFVLPNAHYLWYASRDGHYIEHRVQVHSTGPDQFLQRRL